MRPCTCTHIHSDTIPISTDKKGPDLWLSVFWSPPGGRRHVQHLLIKERQTYHYITTYTVGPNYTNHRIVLPATFELMQSYQFNIDQYISIKVIIYVSIREYGTLFLLSTGTYRISS